MRMLLFCLAVALAGAAPAVGQSVLVVDAVGPADFTDIGAALQAAQPGDVILVVPSAVYAGFTVDKGVVIRSAGGQFSVDGDVFLQNISAGERAGISGMLVINRGSVIVSSSQGMVFLERVSLTGTNLWAGSLSVVQCDNFLADGITVGDAVWGTAYEGAVSIDQSFARIAGLTAYPAPLAPDGSYASVVVTGSTVEIADPRRVVGAEGLGGTCFLGFCVVYPSNGGPAIYSRDSKVLVVGTSQQSLTGGAGGIAFENGFPCPACPSGLDGPSVTLVNSTLTISRVQAPDGAQGHGLRRDDRYAILGATEDFLLGMGLSWSIDSIEPGAVVFLLSDLAGSFFLPYVGPQLAVVPGSFFLVVPVGRTDALGKLTLSLPGSISPALLGLVFVSQAIVRGDSGSIYLTNPATRVMGANFQDCNGNGVPDMDDIALGNSQDCDQNGYPDECDFDCDQNGLVDACEIAADPGLDCNANGILDTCIHLEIDCDGNGVVDACEIAADPGLDCNQNGILDACIDLETDCNQNGFPDQCDVAGAFSPDCNLNGIPDECDVVSGFSDDCNLNGVPDECDVASGFSPDCNANGIPDECEMDCNGNGVPDDCDVASGFSLDCNLNGTPDECESTDCNGNDVPDDCDIASGFSLDCNANGIPDECEMDCNGNGVPDDCDIASGFSPDLNLNGIPDECELDSTRHVPGDFPTIQAAIDGSLDGDTILVADGNWSLSLEPIDLRGKAIHLRSENGPANCALDPFLQARGMIFQSGEGPDTVIEGFTFRDCGMSFLVGGGAYVVGASPTFRNCVFEACVADDGGAVYLEQSSAMFRNCRFTGNRVNRNGAAVYSLDSSPSFRDCLFDANLAVGNGGAVYATQQSHGDFTQCTFGTNSALGLGGGGPVAEAMALFASNPTLSGCIFWTNEAVPADLTLTSDGVLPALVRYSDLEGGVPPNFVDGGGNLSLDPLFTSPAAGDFHLLPGSPCIDAGDPLFVPELGETDLDGEPRVQGAAVDIGVDET